MLLAVSGIGALMDDLMLAIAVIVMLAMVLYMIDGAIDALLALWKDQ